MDNVALHGLSGSCPSSPLGTRGTFQSRSSAVAPPARVSPGIQTGNVRLDGFQGFIAADSSSPRAMCAPHGCVCL